MPFDGNVLSDFVLTSGASSGFDCRIAVQRQTLSTSMAEFTDAGR